MKSRRFLLAVAFSLWLLVASGFAGDDKGWFGLTIKVDAPFFSLNPVLGSVTVTKIAAGSPASKAGVTAGDHIVQVEGVAIVGRRAKEIEPLMQKAVGETLHLQMKHPNGTSYSASLAAEAEPAGK